MRKALLKQTLGNVSPKVKPKLLALTKKYLFENNPNSIIMIVTKYTLLG